MTSFIKAKLKNQKVRQININKFREAVQLPRIYSNTMDILIFKVVVMFEMDLRTFW